MGDEMKSFCDHTVLFRVKPSGAAITECPREVDSKVQIQNADCRLQYFFPLTLFPRQLCRLFPRHFHTLFHECQQCGGGCQPYPTLTPGHVEWRYRRREAETRQTVCQMI